MALPNYKKVVLVVLDGFGVASYSHGNAVALAHPEGLNTLISHYPSATLLAAGPVVGLPWGEVGNSEVGHLNMGAGRIVGQDLPRINRAIQDHSFFKNEVLLGAVNHVKQNQSKLHLMGMVSDGGVHSSEDHLYALLGLASENGCREVFIHMFTDGRDTPEKAALDALTKLQSQIHEIGVGQIATVTGRFYAMDRAQHWEQTEMTYRALVNGAGDSAESAEAAILNSYNQNIFDEMIKPTVIVSRDEAGNPHPVTTIGPNDAVIFFNHRSDRAIQLTKAFVQPEVMELAQKHEQLANLYFVTMTEYFFGMPVHVAYPPINLENNLAEYLAKHGYRQFHIAESEKYAHVTSFFNGGASEPFPGEDRVIVKSPENNRNYAAKPEMSGLELAEQFVDHIKNGDYQFYLANFANPDMVGHTGDLQASIKAVQYIDRFLQMIVQAVLEVDGALIITADHGNVEIMLDLKTGEINKEHTTSPVPILLITKEAAFAKPKVRDYLALSSHTPLGVISDIAPTVLALFGLPKPPEMDGISVLEQLLEA